MNWSSSAFAWLLLVYQQYGAVAQPTWPASTDELEDIMLLNTGYRARGFATAVTPCSTGAGPGRIAAAEWIRTAFHDLATGNVYFGSGGLDASLQYELNSGENIGSAFLTTLTTYAPFFSSQTSLSDIIAAGVYTATRSCGGPVIPVRGGHIDATVSGPLGVPLPQNDLGTFKNQFLRFGYNATEMIAFTACGHTVGSVHSENFPDIVPSGFTTFDSSSTVFDTRVATEFVQGVGSDPLVYSKTKKNSDLVVFTSDNNATIKSLTDAATFASTCQTMFQRMIEIVPTGVTLTSPITPYEVKPYGMQLTLLAGGSSLQFTGDIRIRTTQRSLNSIAQVQLAYKDRTSAAASIPISTTYKSDAQGFDDSFSFFGFDTILSADLSISSFKVIITVSGGSTETWDNNGNGFKVDDSIIYQGPQSCIDGSGKLIVVAALRNSTSSPNLKVVVRNAQASPNPVPSLSTASAAMTTQSAVGSYQLYSAAYTFSGSQAQTATFGVFAGGSSDNYKNATSLPTTCAPLGSSTPTTTPSSAAYAFQGCYSDNGAQRALSASTSADDSMTVDECAAFCSSYQFLGLEYGRECYCGNTLDTSSTIVGLSQCNMPCSGNSQQTCGAASRLSTYKNLKYVAPGNSKITGYNYLGCYSEGSAGRALADSGTASDTMTVETCESFCSGSTYFGVEYGRECYCGAQIQAGSTLQSASDCSMLCSGNTTEYCGAGNRLDIYQKATISSSSSLTPTLTPSSSLLPVNSSIVMSSQSSTASHSTIAVSSTSTILITSTPTAPTSSVLVSTSSTLSPNLLLSSTGSVASSTPFSTSTTAISSENSAGSSTVSQTASFSSTPTPTSPSLYGYDYIGCLIDSVETRVLGSKTTISDNNTYTTCAAFCSGYQYFGVEYGDECYCADNLPSTIAIRPDAECNVGCTGDSTKDCGAAFRINVFKSSIIYTPPSNPVIPGFNYTGCHTDSVGARVLQGGYHTDSNMTIAKCAGYCAGTMYFGTEYGGECYCGDELSSASQLAPETDCSFICPGNREEYCGAGSRLSLWQKITTNGTTSTS